MASTQTVLQIIDPLRTYPELGFLCSGGGFSLQPALSIANRVMQKFLAQTMDWKFNRAIVPTFLTVALQQDYITNVTDLSWLEQGWRLDINNTATPKPYFTMESVRDLMQTSYQSVPFQLSWVPNNLAIMGKWKANTVYACGYGQASTPVSPIQQFTDTNGNILFINSNSLGLSLSSPGFSGTPISTTPPYGTSGNSQPFAAPAAVAGTTVTDGTVTWTVADPNAIAIRLAPIPATSGLCWLTTAVYQKKPPYLTSLGSKITPIPDEFIYLFQEGFLAFAYEQSPEPGAARKAPAAYAKWEENLMTALRSADREREAFVMYPSEGITGGAPWSMWPFMVGPAFPYWPGGY